MDQSTLIVVGIAGIFALLNVVAIPLLYAKLYKKVSSGQALIINKQARVEVYFTGGLVIPAVHKAEVMDISVKRIGIERTGNSGVVCKDDIRADIHAAFFVRVGKTAEDVLKVAQAIGAERASQQETLDALFCEKLSEAIKIVARQFDFEDLYTRRGEFTEQILEVVGADLNGYVLEDLAIDFLEQTPIEALDKNNILDAAGIRKITEITTEQEIVAHELLRKKAQHQAQLGLEAKELLIEIERRQADALGKLREQTGKTLTVEQLEDRLTERLQQMVDTAVKQRLPTSGTAPAAQTR